MAQAGAGGFFDDGGFPAGQGWEQIEFPANAKAGEVIGYLSGTRPAPAGLDLIKIEAQRHAVPQCAMRVMRMQEMGPTAPFAPAGACGCYYEKLATGATACGPCAVAGDCSGSAQVCSYGYCEAQ